MNINDRIKRVLSEVLTIPATDISDDFSQNHASQWSSLAHLTVVLALEEEFQVRFTDAETLGMTTFRQIQSALASKGIR
jgi:acyl carrier protein